MNPTLELPQKGLLPKSFAVFVEKRTSRDPGI
jgi:hypothetical protein